MLMKHSIVLLKRALSLAVVFFSVASLTGATSVEQSGWHQLSNDDGISSITIIANRKLQMTTCTVDKTATSATTPNFSVTVFNTIQAAIDQPTCDTIDLLPSGGGEVYELYEENLFVDRSLTLNGNCNTLNLVVPNDCLGWTPAIRIDGGTAANANTVKVTINQLKMTTNSFSQYGAINAGFTAINLTVEECDIFNFTFGIIMRGELTLSKTTISHCKTGIHLSSGSSATIRQSTISSNSAAISSGGPGSNDVMIEVTFSTFWKNRQVVFTNVDITISNSLVTGGDILCRTSLTDGGYNLIGVDESSFDNDDFFIPGNDAGCNFNYVTDGNGGTSIKVSPQDLLIGGLPTEFTDTCKPRTQPLGSNSPAIGSADPEKCALYSPDQIGTPRGCFCDIGAVEFGNDLPCTQTPTVIPRFQPSAQPSRQDTVQPTTQPSASPISRPNEQVTAQPSRLYTAQPAAGKPSAPSIAQPTDEPSAQSVLQCTLVDTSCSYNIIARHSALGLGVQDDSTEEASAIIQVDPTSQSDSWRLESVGTDGFYHIVNDRSGLAINVDGASSERGRDLIQWPIRVGADNDNWCFMDAGGGYYQILAKHSGQALDIAGVDLTAGAAAVQWTPSQGLNQQFRLTCAPKEDACAEVPTYGYFRIVAQHSGLGLRGDSFTSNVIQSAVDNTYESDNWRFENTGNGYYHIINEQSGEALNVSGASTTDGSDIIEWPLSSPNDSTNDNWCFQPVENGAYMIVAEHSGKAIDVAGASMEDGAQLIQWSIHGNANQHFRLESI